jgi:uncharacterized protein YdeI (BOF family)
VNRNATAPNRFGSRVIAAIAAMLILAPGIVAAQTTTVGLEWDANTDGNTTGYRLYWGTSPTTMPNAVDAGNATTRQLTLNNGSTYYFVVRAYNASGVMGPASNQASIALDGSPPPPSVTFTGTLVGSSTAVLNWQTSGATSVALNGAAVDLSGSAQFAISATTTYTLVAVGPGGTVTRTATVTVGVVNCVLSAWSFQSATAWSACSGGQQTRTETWVRSIVTPPSGGGAACGPLTETRTATQSCSSTPQPPTATLTGTLSGTNTANLSWQTTNATSVTLNGAAVAQTGSAQYTITAATTYTLVATGPGGSVTRTATVTPNSGPVDCVVSAWSLQSATAWSVCTGGQQSRTETWTRTILSPPVNGGAACGPLQEDRVVTQACNAAPTAPGAPVNVHADVSGSTVVLSWGPDPTAGAPAAYLVSAGSAPGASDLAASLPVGLVTSVSASLPDGVYYARIKAQNTLGTSANSAEVSFTVGTTGPPNAPVGLTGSLQNWVATLAWSPAAPAEGVNPEGYVLEAGSGPGLSDLASLPVGNVTRFQAASVPPGVYYVRVRAINRRGVSAPSPEVVLRATAVGAPQALTSAGPGNIVELRWQAPAGGEVPAGYLIEAGSAPGLIDLAAWRVGIDLAFATTAPTGVYYVRVRAVDAAGVAGEASNEIVVRR